MQHYIPENWEVLKKVEIEMNVLFLVFPIAVMYIAFLFSK